MRYGFPGKVPTRGTLRFLDEYVKDFNAIQAGARAKCTKAWIHRHGYPAIRRYGDYIKWKHALLADKTAAVIAVDQEWVLRRMINLADANPQDYVVKDGRKWRYKRLDELTREQAAAVRSFTVSKDGTAHYELHDAAAAQQNLGRHLGMFNEKVILEHRHRHMHAHYDLTSVPLETLEKIEEMLLNGKGEKVVPAIEHKQEKAT